MKYIALCSTVIAVAFAASFTASTSAETPTPTVQSSKMTNATCPVVMAKLQMKDNAALIFEYENATKKDIAGIEFGAAYSDAVQEPHRVVVTGGWKNLRAGYSRFSALNIKYWRHTNYTGWMIWPSRILYKDGSSWQMGKENDSCGMEVWRDRKVHVAYSPSQILNFPETASLSENR
jgi:hypothetical protein